MAKRTFKQWWDDQPNDRPMYPCDPCTCPVGTWLTEEYGVTVIHIPNGYSENGIMYIKGQKPARPPAWMKKVVLTIDRAPVTLPTTKGALDPYVQAVFA